MSKRHAILSKILFSCFIVILLGIGSTQMQYAEAATIVFDEGFSNTTYQDATYTNVTGWGTGAISLPRQAPYIVSTLSTSDVARDVMAVGTRAYIANGASGLCVVDISNPASPSILGSRATPNTATNVYVSGNYAYVTGTSIGIRIIDISQPTFPNAGSYDGPSYNSIFVSGRYAYVTNSNGFYIIDVLNPAATSLTGYWLTGANWFTSGVYVLGTYAYVTEVGSSTASGALRIFDVSSPASPSLVGSFGLPSWGRSVWVEGNYAYTAAYIAGLRVVNVTVKNAPTSAGVCDISHDGYLDIGIDSGFAYMADDYYGVRTIKITNPAAPTLMATCDTPVGAVSVYPVGQYLCVADGSTGLIMMRTEVAEGHLPDLYNSTGVGQSLSITASNTIVKATLSQTAALPAGTSINYYLSADNGVHWESVSPGVEHVFSYPGLNLKWKAVLATTDPTVSPVIESLSISYCTKLPAPSLSSPADGSITTDTTPTFLYSTVTGASSYRVQLDRVSSFDSEDLLNYTTGATSFTPASPLADGLWYWRVAAREASGEEGFFSLIRSLTIDSTAPTWDQEPTDRQLEFGLLFRYDLNASDLRGIDEWWINDTIHFMIDSDGIIENVTPLEVQSYGIQVWVNDTIGNTQTDIFTLSVEDTTEPDWNPDPENQVIEFGENLDYTVYASDLSDIDHYWINDTSIFDIDEDGWMTSSECPDIGIYWLEVRAYDPYGLYCSAIISITVADSTAPEWQEELSNQVLELGEIFTYDINATDLSGIASYWVNNTDFFAISSEGILSDLGNVELGIYWIEIRAYDDQGLWCSAIISITCQDTKAPTWDEPPTDIDWEYGIPLVYDLNASDPSGIVSYWISDPSAFSISLTGVITNATWLGWSDYYLEVRAYDPLGYYCSAFIWICVADTCPPCWNHEICDQYVEFAEKFRYDMNATDWSYYVYYSVNDTGLFYINDDGLVTNNTVLAVGVYGVEISAWDYHDNLIKVAFQVIVQDTTAPTWTVTPEGELLNYGDSFEKRFYAEDASGIHSWDVNNTEYFSIDIEGLMMSVKFLDPGIYNVLITLQDPYGNSLNATIQIVVLQSTITTSTTTTTSTDTSTGTSDTDTGLPPVEPTPLIYMVLGFAAIGIVVVVIVVFLSKRTRG